MTACGFDVLPVFLSLMHSALSIGSRICLVLRGWPLQEPVCGYPWLSPSKPFSIPSPERPVRASRDLASQALYVAFVVLALTNIATGMFVQASLGAHEKQREKVRVE